jgi:hypothetical protein
MTSLHAYQFTLKLSLVAPFLSHKTGAQRFGYDMSMLRDVNGEPVFLGSQIRGNLLHVLKYFESQLKQHKEQRQELETLISYFGNPSEQTDDSANTPDRAKLNFDFYWRLNEAQLSKLLANAPSQRFRIGIDETTQTTVKGNLQVMEALFASGEQVDLSGAIYANISEVDAVIVNRWLNKAGSFLPAIGALKGAGFGRIIQANCSFVKQDYQRDIAIGVCLKLDRPFCIARPHLPNSNRFVSEEFIPGNAIIGAIAEQYPKLTGGKSWFNKLHVRHAFAVPAFCFKRSAVLPLSLAIYKGKRLVDWALTPSPDKILLKKIDNKPYAPAFQSDWKDQDYDTAKKYCQLSDNSYQRYLIVRTAIEAKTNQAQDSALFSLECIASKDDFWYTEIRLGQDMSEDEIIAAEAALKQIFASPLYGIGKTKAKAELSVMTQAAQHLPIQAIKDQYYIITLQTQARLLAMPSDLKATGDDAALMGLYHAYWQSVSKNQLTLNHYFAQQTLVGGEFYWRRYRKHPKEPYQPEWLTQPGSVFVLKAAANSNEQNIRELLEEWQQYGLPQAADKQQENWQTNPFIRENGFGEIRLNDAIHLDFADYQGDEWQ